MYTPTGWAHSYRRTAKLGEQVPAGPYAWYLTNRRLEYVFVVFDLDAGRFGRQAVERDADELLVELDAADVRYLVCESGPGGGVHVWVPVVPTAAAVVRQIAYAAARRWPTLDKSPLTNPATGCVRPPGAPHRAGGYSVPVWEWMPVTAAAAAAALSVPNDGEAVERLAVVLGAEEVDAGQVEAERVRPVESTARGARLAGRRRPCDVAGLLAATPPPERGHAHLARILVRLALARWSLPEVAELVAAHRAAPGLVHLRRQDSASGPRERSRAEQVEVLARQWDRTVAYASTLRREQPAGDDVHAEEEWVRRVAAVVEVVASVEQAIEAETASGRWARQSGPSDRKALEYVMEVALVAVSALVEVDCRRLALETGMGKSTAARALMRLCLDGWLKLEQAGEGQRAHGYRLLPQVVDEQPAQPAAHGRVPHRPAVLGDAAGHPVTQEISGGDGTQATPRPALDLRPALTERARRIQALQHRRSICAHDAFAHPNQALGHAGLGRHAAATAAAVHSHDLYKVKDLAAHTGYSRAATRRHLTVLTRHQLDPRPGTSARSAAARERLHRRLDRAARQIGSSGRRERRHRRYAIEREAWRWWLEELEWMKTTGKRRPTAPGQRRLVLAGAPRYANRDAYPRDHRGRADHRAARARLVATRAAAA
ncbi:hypothetical protein ACIBHY_53890 [Nonomuraea sp. NPDC050547]|uniref:hypothetical protein n=1 Tax=Nonomuraea sp. NPDC050547 TaxID=3364368 RepID=UPI00378D8020